MTTREEIVLKVPQDVAETYRQATEEEKAQIAARVSVMLKSGFSKKLVTTRLSRIMDDSGEQAPVKVLTPEILDCNGNDDRGSESWWKERKLRQDWAGMLKAEGYTSVEMQHLASEWRNT